MIYYNKNIKHRIYNIHWPAPGWLERFRQFWCTPGGIGARFFPTGANLVQGWVWAVLCASAGRCTEKKHGCWKTTFSVSKNNYLVKTWCWESIFWGSEILMKLLEGFHEVAGEAWRGWSHYPCPAGFLQDTCPFPANYPSQRSLKKEHLQNLAKIWHHLSSGKFRHRF